MIESIVSFEKPQIGFVSSKIQTVHLERSAALYIRQSTSHQLREHQESTARQYQLASRLKLLGWREDQIITIDEDLGVSGSGHVKRDGFRRLLKLITDQQVGMVLGLEMSRLARNSKDWSDLFEVCAIFDTLIADEDGVFQPNDPNDRLVLGLKGIISEMELHTMRIRLERGRLNKAQRGELFHDFPVGFVKGASGMPEFDPDESAKNAIEGFFELFNVMGSSHSLFHHMATYQIKLPYRKKSESEIEWRVPSKTHVYEILKHPLYAGTYSYGKRKNYKKAGKTTQKKHLPPDQWKVRIIGKFPGYISWQQYLDNQARLSENNNRPDRTGPAKGGNALLGGILFCGCGRRMSVSYSTANSGSYYCNRHATIADAKSCRCTITVKSLDTFVARKLLQSLEPAQVDLSLRVADDESARRQQLERQSEHRLQRAEYDVDVASRRYKTVDPANRLVAATLESQWETALRELDIAKQEYTTMKRTRSTAVSQIEREQMVSMCSELGTLWKSEATNVERKQISRLMIERVTVAVQDRSQSTTVTIRWSGGYESCHGIERPIQTYAQLDNYQELIDRALSLTLSGMRSPVVASILTQEGFRTPRNQEPLSCFMVSKILNDDEHAKKQLNAPELLQDYWYASSLATQIGVPEKLLKHWVSKGWANAIQRPFGRTWVIWANEPELRRLEALARSQAGQGSPSPTEELRTPTPKVREKT